jgi:hypothetical protein
MERHPNTYRSLINNKFSELKELLDKNMPEKKKRKWLFWFSTKAGIIAIVLFSIFASAAGAYIGFTQKKQENQTVPVQEKNEIKKTALKNDESVNKNTSPEIINIQPGKKPKVFSHPAAIKNKGALQTSATHKGKTTDLPVKQLIPSVQNKDTLSKNPVAINVSVKDSTTVANPSPQTEVTQRKRAF